MPRAAASRLVAQDPDDLHDCLPLSRKKLAVLASQGMVLDALFLAGDYHGQNGLVLVVRFRDEDGETKKGVLYKQDNLPRVFGKPDAIVTNARKLGIPCYRIDASRWRYEYYDQAAAQTLSHKRKREQGL